MLVREAHRILSLNIGDSIIPQNAVPGIAPIPDGVRFTRTERDGYLYRAMLATLMPILTVINKMSYRAAASVIGRMLPTMIMEYSLPVNAPPVNYGGATGSITFGSGLPVFPLFTLGASYNLPFQNLNIPIPIKNNHYTKQALTNQRSAQFSDPFAVLYLSTANFPVGLPSPPRIWDLIIYDLRGDLSQVTVINVTFIPYPLNPVNQCIDNATFLDYGDELLFEESLVPQMLSHATLLALSDSQDIINEDRYLPMQMQLENNQFVPPQQRNQ